MSTDLDLEVIDGLAACGFPIPGLVALDLVRRVKAAEQERDEARDQLDALGDSQPRQVEAVKRLVGSGARLLRIERDDARGRAERAETRLAKARAYVDHPGNWSALDGRRTKILALIDGVGGSEGGEVHELWTREIDSARANWWQADCECGWYTTGAESVVEDEGREHLRGAQERGAQHG